MVLEIANTIFHTYPVAYKYHVHTVHTLFSKLVQPKAIKEKNTLKKRMDQIGTFHYLIMEVHSRPISKN